MSLAKILKDSKYLISMFSPHLGETIDDILFADLIKYVGGQMKLSHDELQTAANSVRHYKYQTLTRDILQCIVLRLLANKRFLKEQVEIPYWDGTASDSILLCLGISYEPSKNPSNRLLNLHCIALTGIPAGLKLLVRKSANQINYFMYKFMSTGKGGYEAEEIAKLMFRCTVEDKSNILTDIKNISVTPFIKERNKVILEKRYDPQKCKTPNKLCWTCKKCIRECPLACRYKEYDETTT